MTVLFTERRNEEVLLRNLAAICIQQETDLDSGDRKLHCSVLRANLARESFLVAQFRAAFFMRVDDLNV
jgi:hypothetical protein